MFQNPAAGNAKPILILLAGRTFPDLSKTIGDFDDWIAEGLGNKQALLCMDARTNTSLPAPAELAGVVVSGSHAMVSDRHPWSENLARWLKTCVGAQLPVLGICYGHQLLAHACGGVVDYHPAGLEIGTKQIELSANAAQDLLFSAAPPTFPAHLVHSQSVRKLPQQAILLAGNEHESHQAFRIGPYAWGVQFHPEFSVLAMRGYIQQLEKNLAGKQCDAQVLNAAVTDTPAAHLLLRRFAELCNGELCNGGVDSSELAVVKK